MSYKKTDGDVDELDAILSGPRLPAKRPTAPSHQAPSSWVASALWPLVLVVAAIVVVNLAFGGTASTLTNTPYVSDQLARARESAFGAFSSAPADATPFARDVDVEDAERASQLAAEELVLLDAASRAAVVAEADNARWAGVGDARGAAAAVDWMTHSISDWRDAEEGGAGPLEAYARYKEIRSRCEWKDAPPSWFSQYSGWLNVNDWLADKSPDVFMNRGLSPLNGEAGGPTTLELKAQHCEVIAPATAAQEADARKAATVAGTEFAFNTTAPAMHVWSYIRLGPFESAGRGAWHTASMFDLMGLGERLSRSRAAARILADGVVPTPLATGINSSVAGDGRVAMPCDPHTCLAGQSAMPGILTHSMLALDAQMADVRPGRYVRRLVRAATALATAGDSEGAAALIARGLSVPDTHSSGHAPSSSSPLGPKPPPKAPKKHSIADSVRADLALELDELEEPPSGRRRLLDDAGVATNARDRSESRHVAPTKGLTNAGPRFPQQTLHSAHPLVKAHAAAQSLGVVAEDPRAHNGHEWPVDKVRESLPVASAAMASMTREDALPITEADIHTGRDLIGRHWPRYWQPREDLTSWLQLMLSTRAGSEYLAILNDGFDDAVAVTGFASAPVDAVTGEFIEAPPMHLHHSHFYDEYRHLFGEWHADSHCKASEGGAACNVLLLPEGFRMSPRKPLLHPIDVNDARKDPAPTVNFHIEAFVRYQWACGGDTSYAGGGCPESPATAVPLASLESASEATPIALMTSTNPGAGVDDARPAAGEKVGSLGIYEMAEEPTMLWYTQTLPVSGTFVSNFFHTHQKSFHSGLIFIATPEELGLLNGANSGAYMNYTDGLPQQYTQRAHYEGGGSIFDIPYSLSSFQRVVGGHDEISEMRREVLSNLLSSAARIPKGSTLRRPRLLCSCNRTGVEMLSNGEEYARRAKLECPGEARAFAAGEQITSLWFNRGSPKHYQHSVFRGLYVRSPSPDYHGGPEERTARAVCITETNCG